jgi:hypothetical protein
MKFKLPPGAQKIAGFPIPSPQNFPDLEFRCSAFPGIQFHKCVLGIRASKLLQIIEDGASELFSENSTAISPETARGKEIHFFRKSVTGKVFLELRNFVYTGEVNFPDFSPEEHVALLVASKICEIPELETHCHQKLLKSLNSENASEFLFLAATSENFMTTETTWIVNFMKTKKITLSLMEKKQLPPHIADCVQV